MHLLLLGLNHQSAPVAVRERVAFPSERLPDALADMRKVNLVSEAAIISTCNRTECYCVVTDLHHERIVDWLNTHHNLEAQDIRPYLYAFEDFAMVRHVFRVSSGLDSMVLGEPQILGQMKEAFKIAQASQSTGKLLNRLFQKSFAVAKEVRTKTDIGAHAISVASTAVNLATRIYSNMSEQTVLLVGAGETIELCAYHLREKNIGNIIVANRTLSRARQLAQLYDASAITLRDIPEYLSRVDIVVSSTASQLPILGKGMIESALRERKYKQMLLIDLAVPRDIEIEAGALDGVYLYNVDDLQKIVEQNMHNRKQAAVSAEGIVEAEALRYIHWVDSLAAVPTIRALRRSIHDICEIELERAQQRLRQGEAAESVLRSFARTLTNKFIHEPVVNLKKHTATQGSELHRVVRKLFKLSEE